MNNRIERIAGDLLKESGESDSPPVDPEVVADYLNLPVAYEQFSDGLSGVLVRKHGKKGSRIIINKGDPKNRQRFSVAHECGHYVLNHPGEVFVDNAFLNRRDVRSSYAIDQKEIEANAFAAALLMPKNLVIDCSIRIVQEKLMKSQKEIIRFLAKDFAVSEQAMGYRLINLGIVTTSGD